MNRRAHFVNLNLNYLEEKGIVIPSNEQYENDEVRLIMGKHDVLTIIDTREHLHQMYISLLQDPDIPIDLRQQASISYDAIKNLLTQIINIQRTIA